MTLPSETHLPTPLPLSCRAAQEIDQAGWWLVHDAKGRRVCAVPPGADSEQRATEITRAANAHRELVQCLRDCIDSLEHSFPPGTPGIALRLERIGAAREALKVAEAM